MYKEEKFALLILLSPGWQFDSYRLVSLKLGMMIDNITVYILIPVWVTLIFIHVS